MAKIFQTPINLSGLELLNARIQNLSTAPASPTAGLIYYDTALGYARVYSGGAWVNIVPQAAGYTDEQAQDAVAALITAGTNTGLTITYDDPNNTLSFTITDGAITTAKLADGAVTNVKVSASAAISADKLADGTNNVVMTNAERTKLANIQSDAAANVASLRTIGTGALQAAAGNDARLSDARNPIAGSVTNGSVATNAAISADKLADGSTNVIMTATERSKLQGIAAGATANSTDAQLRDRSTHTGTQSADTLTNGTTNGVFTQTEKTKLAGVATGATNYTDTNARANRLDQFAAPTTAVAFNSQRITGLADPVSAQDAATKNYVDTYAQGLDFKNSVGLATAAALPANTYANGTAGVGATLTASANATLAVDGQTAVTGQRILVKNEATAANNGIYVVTNTGSGSAAYVLTRATDADTSAKVTAGTVVYVEQGSVNATQQWVLTTTGTITIGTTAQTWTQFSGASTLTAGAGLTAAGNQFNIGQGTGIVVSADAIAIDTTVVNRKYAQAFGDGTATSFTITHNLNTRDIIAQIYTNGGNYDEIEADIQRTTVNTVTVIFATAPAASAYRITITG